MKISDILNEDERVFRRSKIPGRFHYTTTQKSKPPVTHPVRGTIGAPQTPVRYGSYTGGSLAKSMEPPKQRAVDTSAMRRAAEKAGLLKKQQQAARNARVFKIAKKLLIRGLTSKIPFLK